MRILFMKMIYMDCLIADFNIKDSKYQYEKVANIVIYYISRLSV